MEGEAEEDVGLEEVLVVVIMGGLALVVMVLALDDMVLYVVVRWYDSRMSGQDLVARSGGCLVLLGVFELWGGWVVVVVVVLYYLG